MKIKVMTVFGTRPEAIKMAPLVQELKKHEEFETLVCVTAQHREMLDQVLEIFNIKPDVDLNIMKDRQTLLGITTRGLEGLAGVFDTHKPDIVLVHGDTTTTFVGALAAFYNKVKVGHVEAGLRTFDKYSPFPEEMNRSLTGRLTDIHFSPTLSNKQNLLNEGIKDNIYITGNTVIDAIKTTVKEDYVFDHDILSNVDFEGKKVILVTAHRRENLGEPLRNICTGIRKVVETYPDVEVIYPVHLNPAVQEVAKEILGEHDRIHLIEPLDVEDLHNIMARCYMVMTDSGGLQEEAPALGKPVLVLRNETERPEAVIAGTVKIAGTNSDTIFNLAKELITDENKYQEMSRAINPYGDGLASKRIVQALKYYFKVSTEKPEEF